MNTWMLWNGGSSYAHSDNFNRADCERFDSLAAAKHEFKSRLHDTYYPCVENDTPDNGGPWAWLCFADPYQIGDLYPDRILELGARGGLTCTRC
jgi:hypothetical protein